MINKCFASTVLFMCKLQIFQSCYFRKKRYLDPPPPINFVDAIHATLGYNWSCGQSSRPPSFVLAMVLGLPTYPSRGARSRNCLNLT